MVHIDYIDGVENYSSVMQAYITPQTYGKATVYKSYKGVFTDNQQITFYRTRGKLSFHDYVKTRPEREQAKLNKMHEKPQYVIERFEGDIDVEAGKTYLAYFVEVKDVHNQGAYAMIHYQTGLREVRNAHALSMSDIQVLNNYTNKWERLDDII